MKCFITCSTICLLLTASYLYGETVFAGSNLFTFPAMTAIKTQPFTPQPITFSAQQRNRFTNSVTFNWNIPSRSLEKQGMITIYSLLGQVVAHIPVTNHNGSALWDLSNKQTGNGLYLARISYGRTTRNLKLMLWN